MPKTWNLSLRQLQALGPCDDTRPRKAIDASRLYVNGEISAAAWAAAWAAAEDASRDAECKFQLERLILWLSADEPAPLPFPERPNR